MRECDKKPSDTLWHGGQQWVPIRDWDRMRMLAEHYESEWGKSCSWANRKAAELEQEIADLREKLRSEKEDLKYHF